MQMIATAKFTAALARAKATRPYTDRIRGLVGEVAAAAGDDFSHPLMKAPASPTKKELVLVVTSDRGLCGAYNGNVLRKANQTVKALKAAGKTVHLETVGKKAVAYFRFARIDIAERHTFGDKPQFAQVEALAKRLMADFSVRQVRRGARRLHALRDERPPGSRVDAAPSARGSGREGRLVGQLRVQPVGRRAPRRPPAEVGRRLALPGVQRLGRERACHAHGLDEGRDRQRRRARPASPPSSPRSSPASKR